MASKRKTPEERLRELQAKVDLRKQKKEIEDRMKADRAKLATLRKKR